MADALDSKSSDRKVVWVQVPPPVLLSSKDLRRFGVSLFLFRWTSTLHKHSIGENTPLRFCIDQYLGNMKRLD